MGVGAYFTRPCALRKLYEGPIGVQIVSFRQACVKRQPQRGNIGHPERMRRMAYEATQCSIRFGLRRAAHCCG